MQALQRPRCGLQAGRGQRLRLNSSRRASCRPRAMANDSRDPEGEREPQQPNGLLKLTAAIATAGLMSGGALIAGDQVRPGTPGGAGLLLPACILAPPCSRPRPPPRRPPT